MTLYKKIPIQQLFNIKRGNAKLLSQRIPSYSSNSYPLITSQAHNAGVLMNTIRFNTDTLFNNAITVAMNGEVGYTTYHPTHFLASSDVAILSLFHYHLNVMYGLYMATCIRDQCRKYNFGYKLTLRRLKKMRILIPISNHHINSSAIFNTMISFIDLGKEAINYNI